MSPGLPAVKEVFEEHSEATGAPESDTRPEQDSLDPNPEASLPHQVASPERGSPERRRRPQLPSGAFSGSGFLSPKSGSASGQSLLAWAEQKGLCSPVSPDSRRSTMSSRAGKWSPAANDPYSYACGSPTMRNRRSFMSLEQLFALCKELKIMPDLMSRQAVVRIFKRAQCAGSASAHGGSNFGYLSQEAFVDAMGRIAVQAYTEEPYCDEYPEPHEKILAFLSDRLPGQIRTMRESFRYGCSGRGPAVTPGYIGRR